MDNRPNNKPKPRNIDYEQQMKNFIGKEIIVTDTESHTFEGKCLAISFPYLNVVLDSDNGLVVIRNIANVRVKL